MLEKVDFLFIIVCVDAQSSDLFYNDLFKYVSSNAKNYNL